MVGEPGQTYEIGKKIPVTAKPHIENEFLRWESPYDGEAIEFSIDAGDHVSPTPTFTPILSKFQHLDHEWEAINAKAATDIDTSEGLKRYVRTTLHNTTSDRPFSVQTRIEGPKVLNLKTPNDSNYFDDFKYSLDGKPVQPLLLSADETSASIAIPSGSHTLKLQVSDRGYIYFDRHVSLRDGYLVTLKNMGADGQISPQKTIYRQGETVRLNATKPSEGYTFEWYGLNNSTPNENNEIQFEVNSQLHIEARLWEPISFFGQKFLRAGNGSWHSTNDSYSVSKPNDDRRELIRIQNLEAGTYKFNFNVKSNRVYYPAILSARIGTAPMHLPEQIDPNTPNSIYLYQNSESITLEVFRDSHQKSYSEQELYFMSFSHEPLENDLGPYLNWWNNFDQSEGLDQRWNLLSADIDRDGLSNYAEFLMRTNPNSPDRTLSIKSHPTDSRKLIIQKILPQLNLLENVTVVSSVTLEGAWINTNHLLESEPDGYHIEKNEIDSDGIFFKIQHETKEPPIESLID